MDRKFIVFLPVSVPLSHGNGVWSRVDTDEGLASNCSIIENILPEGVGFSYLIAIFAIPDQFQLTIQ